MVVLRRHLSLDGRDALVIVFYAGLPFDPSYGVGTLRHLRNPSKFPQPLALDHSAIGFTWHRDGKPIAYALNGHKADQFGHQADPFSVEIATSRVDRDGSGYRLSLATPTVEGKPIRAEFRFFPAASTEPIERNLGRRCPPPLDPRRQRLPGGGKASIDRRGLGRPSKAGATTTTTPGPKTCRSR